MSAAAGEVEAAVVVGARRASWEPPERRRSVVGGREGGGCSSLCVAACGAGVSDSRCWGGGGVSFVVIVAVDLGSQREESTAQLSREPSLGAGPCGPPHPGYVRGCVSMTCGVQAVMTCGE